MGLRNRVGLAVAGLAALTGMTVAVGGQAEAGDLGVAGSGYQARITRTEYGIPHITARDMGGAGFGYGYAFAQDNMCVLAEQVVTLRGERSRYFGPDGVADNGIDRNSNLDSDTYYRSVNASGVVQRLQNTQPSTEARRLVAGYAAGVNRYLREVGAAHLSDPTCRGKAWVHPITETDIWRNIHDVNQVGGTGAMIDQIAGATPPKPGTTNRQPSEVDKPTYGSNAWGLGSERTKSGHGMLLANPHFPWHGPRRFYQVQLTVPGSLNATGASVYGTPMIAVGHNASLAWTHTVAASQRFTFFQLALRDGDPTAYTVDGKTERMRKVDVPVRVRGADGSVSTVHRTVYDSRYGPVLADDWTDRSAFAVRGSNTENLGAVDEWLAIYRAKTVDELGAVQRKHQSMPFVNTIAADSAGRTYYADSSVTPNVTDEHAKRCVDTPEGKASYPRLTVLNGSRSECDWGTDADAVRPGTFGPSHWPRQNRRDYVQNANESPWLTNANAPLTGYPRIYGDVGEQRSPRDRLSHEMVGTGPKFDLPRLRETMLNDRVLSAELLKDGTVRMCRTDPALVRSGACRVLADWNGRADIDSPGAVLWREFYFRAERLDDLYTVPFDPQDPVHTPNTLNERSPGVQQALTDAVARLGELGLPLDVPLSRVQRGGTPPASLPIPGGPGAEGCFNVTNTESELLTDDGDYGDVVHGTSFVMALEFTDRGPRANTLMTYSQSSDPTSPHHADQTRLYVRKQWVTDRFTPAEIAADPHARTTVVSTR